MKTAEQDHPWAASHSKRNEFITSTGLVSISAESSLRSLFTLFCLADSIIGFQGGTVERQSPTRPNHVIGNHVRWGTAVHIICYSKDTSCW